jgi:hypothetical protein
MGVFSNSVTRLVEQIIGQPRVKRLYFDYVRDNLNPQSFWSDALDRLRIELDVRRDVLDGVVSSIPATGRVVAIANHPYWATVITKNPKSIIISEQRL